LYTNGGISGYGSGERAVVVVWDQDGHIEWRTQAGWQRTQSPARGEGHHIEAMVDAAGRVYASAGDTLYRQTDGEWRQVALPWQKAVVSKLFPMADGSLLVTSFQGKLARLRDGQAEELSLPDLPAEVRDYRWDESWYSPATNTLWVLTNRRSDYHRSWGDQALLEVSLGPLTVRQHPLSIEGRGLSSVFERMRGVSDPAGDRLAFCDRDRLVYWDGKKGIEVGVWDDGPRSVRPTATVDLDTALVLSAGDQAVYWVAGGTLHRAPLFETEKARQQRLAAERRAHGPLAIPVLHLGLGPVWHVSPAATDAELALDLNAGLLVVFNRSSENSLVGLRPLLTYSYDRSATVGGHFLSAGLGFGGGRLAIAGMYTPRLVVEATGSPRLGFRHGLSVELLATSFNIELAHQVLVADGLAQHDVRLLFGINPGPLVLGAIFAGIMHSIFGR
jgi:hypothetical protein